MKHLPVISKLVYKLLVKLAGSKNKKIITMNNITPHQPFYALTATLNNGTALPFSELKGKKVLIVNTASACGYTPQYDELEKLYETHKDKLAILGFPANDFGAQEPGSDAEIAEFCKINYGVTFPIMQKSSVVRSSAQNPVFAWLTNSSLNGWNNQQPEWNFNKYLVNENGELVGYYPSAVSPLDGVVVAEIEK